MFKLLKHMNWKEWMVFIFVLALLVGHAYLNLLLPQYMAEIGGFLVAGSRPDSSLSMFWEDILWTSLKMVGVVVGAIVVTILVSYLVSYIVTNLMARVRSRLFKNVNKFSMADINKFSIASLITRSTNDITQVQQVFQMVLTMGVTAPITAALAIGKVVSISSKLSIINVVSVLMLVALVALLFFVVVPKFKIMQKNTDKINLITRENLTGLRVVRASAAEKQQEQKFEKTNTYLTKVQLFANRLMTLLEPGISFIMSGTSLAIVWAIAFLASGDPSAVVMMGEFTQYSMQIIMGFMVISMLFMIMPRGMVSAKRINEVLSQKSSLIDGTFRDETMEKGSVVFDNVSFKYPDADEYVLKNISFEAKPGQTVAFIGSTGSGKSTLINLIPRFYDCTEGKVLVDGVDVKEYNTHTLHDKLGYVPQRGVLFSGSVRENIQYGKNEASDDEINHALETSEATFINSIPEKLDYYISQGGKNVSGGQKQRLSIARAVVREPEIFIFDDSFSALDYKTDKVLRRKLKKHCKNATSLIVAQRIGTIMNADQIIVLDNGEIVGKGKHEHLVKECEVYREIALSQLSEEEL